MNESINFPEDRIPQVVALIRRGLKAEKDPVIKRQLERQCREIEDYHRINTGDN